MTLGTLIAERRRARLAPVPLRKLVRLLTPVARALERAHKFSGPDGPVSIVHGDLKPENIFVAQVAGEELVKILDLGIGKLKSAASQNRGPHEPGRQRADGLHSGPMARPSSGHRGSMGKPDRGRTFGGSRCAWSKSWQRGR